MVSSRSVNRFNRHDNNRSCTKNSPLFFISSNARIPLCTQLLRSISCYNMVKMKKHILSAFERLLETKSITLLEPKQESLGDFAVHMKQLQTYDTTLTPEIIIQKLKKSELFDKVEKKDEFINVWIAKKLLFEQLN